MMKKYAVDGLNGYPNELAQKLDDALAQNAELLAALKVAYDAINSLEINAMGTAHISGTGEPYPIRDEVLHNIAKEIKKAEGGE